MNMWMTRKQFATEFDCCVSSANNIFREVKKLVGVRYPRQAVAGSRLNYIVAIDFLTFQKELKDKNLRKYVPGFSPEKIKELILEGREWTI